MVPITSLKIGLWHTLAYFETKYQIKVYWNMFAQSHGKGPVDALGGTVKREVTKMSFQEKYCTLSRLMNLLHSCKYIKKC